MDVSGSGSVRAQANLSMLKKTMDMEESVTQQILQSLPPPPNPQGQGKVIDTYA
jgi:hypothetical protein